MHSGPADGAMSDYVSAVSDLMDKWEKSTLGDYTPPDMYLRTEDGEEITVSHEITEQGLDAVLDYLESEYGFDPADEDLYLEAWYDRDDINAAWYGEQ